MGERASRVDAVERARSLVDAGDVIEFTLRGERRTAVAMLVTDEGAVLVDLLDEQGLAWAEPGALVDVVVFRPETDEVAAAA